jgi:hypothetical protein
LKSFIIAACLSAGSSFVAAQSVTVEAKIDSLQILIGEQAHIELSVAMDANQRAIFPVFKDTLIGGIEVLDVAKADTQYLNDRQRVLIKQQYTITSFDSALYYIPPMSVEVGKEKYQSNSLALKVYSVPVDTLNPEQFFGPKGVMKPDFVWSDWYGLIACIVLFLPFLFLLIYLVRRIRDNKPIIRKVKVEPKLPPHQAAMQLIEKIKSEKKGHSENVKEYYTELTDVIRTYIRDRFGFNALEMTSSEIIERLNENGNKEAIGELKELFVTADLVKFAKHNPMINENDANLINAVDFIDVTKQEEEAGAKPQPTEITIVEKRSLRTKILLGVGIALLAAALIYIIIYVVAQLRSLMA